MSEETRKLIKNETGESEDAEPPKINTFTRDLSNWLTLFAIVFFVIYGILTIVYEIALDLTNVRWAFFGFLICCATDVICYWICRFAVDDPSGGEKFLIYIVMVTQLVTGLYYLVAPIVVLCTYRFMPEVSVTQKDKRVVDDLSKEDEYDEQFYHTFEEYVSPDPCDNEKENDPMWQCGYVRSIKIASCWMIVSTIPKILMFYLLFRILRGPKK